MAEIVIVRNRGVIPLAPTIGIRRQEGLRMRERPLAWKVVKPRKADKEAR